MNKNIFFLAGLTVSMAAFIINQRKNKEREKVFLEAHQAIQGVKNTIPLEKLPVC